MIINIKSIPKLNNVVYKITSPSGRIYVGSTVSLRTRFGKYLKLNCKSQTKLYNSFIKYGVENHTFEVIEQTETHLLRISELKWGEYYNVLDECNMNLALPKGDFYGGVSDSTRQKMSDSHKKRLETFIQPSSIKIINTFTGEEFNTIADASKSINISKAHLSRILKGRAKNWTGMVYLNSDVKLDPKNKTYSEQKKVVLDTATGIYYESITEASELLDIHRSKLTKYLTGRQKNPTNLIVV